MKTKVEAYSGHDLKPADAADLWEHVLCAACGRVHLVNCKTFQVGTARDGAE
jgi:hypothetical protein